MGGATIQLIKHKETTFHSLSFYWYLFEQPDNISSSNKAILDSQHLSMLITTTSYSIKQ
ncbi:hypothetical protein JCM19045_3868 [Bacillus sp. JCM 19045]|nr:hypothetical protein JCM19045_3868 [Bacillus sp. JCM 19045]